MIVFKFILSVISLAMSIHTLCAVDKMSSAKNKRWCIILPLGVVSVGCFSIFALTFASIWNPIWFGSVSYFVMTVYIAYCLWAASVFLSGFNISDWIISRD